MKWYYLIAIIVVIWIGVEGHLHNRDAARKGKNPHSFRFRFRRNTFRKNTTQPYTEDQKINRSWKP